jgi:hypothetical protein
VAFTAKYGVLMRADNVWLQGRHVEIECRNRILLSFNDITPDLAHDSGLQWSLRVSVLLFALGGGLSVEHLLSVGDGHFPARGSGGRELSYLAAMMKLCPSPQRLSRR